MLIQAGQLLAGFALIAVQVLALWGAVEAVHWIYCKARGRSY
jgi:hypothetical protein